MHIKELVKLHILSGGWTLLRGFGIVGVGKCVKISKISDISAHGSTHSNAIDMRLAANERGRQTTYSIRTLDVLKVMLASCYRGEVILPGLGLGVKYHHYRYSII